MRPTKFMHRAGARGLAAALLLSSAAVASPHPAANAAAASRHAEEAPEVLGPLSTSEKQGYGCLVGGGTALGLASITSASDVLLVVTGATAFATTQPLALTVAVAGTIFASTCAVGALVAPTAIRLWKYYYDGAVMAPPP